MWGLVSKLLIYKFHYEYVKNKYDAKLLFTDTDSLVYGIKEKDVYKECFEDRELFDFSDYPLYSKFFDPTNKTTIGEMKDEFKREVISEFIGLNSKMYSLITVKDQEVSKIKGVNKKIKHEEFLDVLFNRKVVKHNMKRNQSKLHNIGTCIILHNMMYCII